MSQSRMDLSKVMKVLYVQGHLHEEESKVMLETNLKREIPSLHFAVVVCSNVWKCFEYMEEFQFDIIFVSQIMEAFSGHELMRLFRNASVQAPIYALVEKDKVADLNEKYLSGFAGYLSVPYSSRELAGAVQQAFNFAESPPVVAAPPVYEQMLPISRITQTETSEQTISYEDLSLQGDDDLLFIHFEDDVNFIMVSDAPKDNDCGNNEQFMFDFTYSEKHALTNQMNLEMKSGFDFVTAR